MKRLVLLTILSVLIFNFTNGQEKESYSELSKKNLCHLEEKQKIDTNTSKTGRDLDKELVAILEDVYQNDQKYRHQLQEVEKEFGYKSNESKSLWKIINEKDSLNLITVKKILDERGWLGTDIIGKQGNETLFLVIQHSDLETQDKYLPMMRNAVNEGNARARDLAHLEDRVALRKGEKQIYGTQIERDEVTGEYYVLPLVDPDNVDKRRVEVGLLPLEIYFAVLKKLGY